jgi:hypothetical protein
MSATGPGPAGEQPTEEELRAAYEAEIKNIRVEQVLLEQVVTLVNLGMRRTGLAPGTEGERDPGQVRIAIEAIRGLLPVVEQVAPTQAGPIRDALSQLQLAYVRVGGQPPPAGSEAGAAPAGSAGGSAAGAPTPDSGPGAPSGGAQRAPGGGASKAPPASEPPEPKPGEPGPAQRSGRLWVPGQ